jgi:hypothetical protein
MIKENQYSVRINNTGGFNTGSSADNTTTWDQYIGGPSPDWSQQDPGLFHIEPTLPTHVISLFEMYLQGKDPETHRDEFIEKIMQLQWVKGNKLVAIQVFHRLRKLFDLLADDPVKEDPK